MNFVELDVLDEALVDHSDLVEQALQYLLKVKQSEEETPSQGLEDCARVYALVESPRVLVQNPKQNVIGWELTQTVSVVVQSEVL